MQPGSLEVATMQSDLGRCLVELGRIREAEPLLTEAYKTMVESLGSESATTKRAAGHLRDLYQRAGDTERAARYAALAG